MNSNVKTLPFSLYFHDDQFPLAIRRMSGSPRGVPPHNHEFSELVIVTRGFIDHEIDGTTTRLSRGDFFILHPGKRHSYPKSSRNAEIYNIIYDASIPIPMVALSGLPLVGFVYPSRMPEGDQRYSGVIARLPPAPLREVLQMLEAMAREARNPGASSALLRASLFSAVVILLARQNDRLTFTARTSWRLNGVVNYMQCHLQDRLPVDRLATLAAMSQSTLQRAFKASFGCGPARYFATLRLKRAAELLRTSDLTVQEVAARTGFCDESHLRRSIAGKLHATVGSLRARHGE